MLRDSLNHGSYPGFTNRAELGMSDPYGAYQQALEVEMSDTVFKRMLVAHWALSEAKRVATYPTRISLSRRESNIELWRGGRKLRCQILSGAVIHW